MISKSGKSLLAIINDILDFSRSISGKLELEQLSVDPATLAKDAASLFSERAREKGLDLASYSRRRRRAASPATPCGSIRSFPISSTTRSSSRNPARVLDARPDPRDAARIRFSVADTGIGIPGDKLADIFGAFTQADQSTTRRFGGTGLGLAISKRLVEAMGGELAVESVFGEGSTFAFSIPMGACVPAEPWPRVAADRASLAIVAVAGDATRDALRGYLTASGYRVETQRRFSPRAPRWSSPTRTAFRRRGGTTTQPSCASRRWAIRRPIRRRGKAMPTPSSPGRWRARNPGPAGGDHRRRAAEHGDVRRDRRSGRCRNTRGCACWSRTTPRSIARSPSRR